MNDEQTNEEIAKFLDLYQNERILWDKSDPNYHSLHLRLSARERIAHEMELGVEKVSEVFNILRSSYLAEAEKVARHDDYSPTLVGFEIMATIMKQRCFLGRNGSDEKPDAVANSPLSSSSATLINQLTNNFGQLVSPVSTMATPMAEEDVPCDVCKSTDSEPSNEMIFCDKCNVCVHQACYGVLKIPKGSWFCKTCELGIEPPCLFCLKTKGAMKSTSDGRWAHVCCALWIREVTFAVPETMETIDNVDKIPKTRWALLCSICRQKGGACIQCYVPKCKVAYHVSCAYENKLHMEMEDIETSECEIKFESFCKNHTANPPKKKTSIEHSAKKPKMEIKNVSNDDEIFAQFLPEEENVTSTSVDVPMKDVSGAENTIVENGDGAQMAEKETETSRLVPSRSYIGTTLVSKATARKSIAIPESIKKKVQLANILPKKVKTVRKRPGLIKKPQVNKVPKANSAKRKAAQSSTVKPPLSALPAPSELNSQGTSGEEPHLGEQLQNNETLQNPPSPNASESSVATIHTLLTPENQQKLTPIKNRHEGLLTKNESNTLSVNCPPSGSGEQSSEIERRYEISSPANCHPPSTESGGFQSIYRNDNLDAFLRYMASLLRTLPLKKSLKIQNKLITQVLKEHDLSSSDDVSDVSSESD